MHFTSIFALLLALAPAASFATSYNCITSPDVPNVFYEYDDAGKKPPTKRITFYRMANESENAAEFLLARIENEGAFPEGKVVKAASYAPEQISGGRHMLEISAGAKKELSVPYLSPRQSRTAKLEFDDMTFAGIKVKKVTYTFCGQD